MVGKEWAVLQLQAAQALETKWGEGKLAGIPCWSLDPWALFDLHDLQGAHNDLVQAELLTKPAWWII